MRIRELIEALEAVAAQYPCLRVIVDSDGIPVDAESLLVEPDYGTVEISDVELTETICVR